MNLRVILISALLFLSSGCSTMNGVSDAGESQFSGSPARDVTHHHSGNKTVNRILSIPFKAVGIVTAGVGLLLVELSTHDYTDNDHRTVGHDDHDTDVGMALTGLGLAIGGGLLYELGDNIADQ